MTDLVKGSRLFPETPSLLSGVFDDDNFFNLSFPRLGNGWTGKVPAANVKENDKEFEIDLAAPGMEKKDFHIDIENGTLCISSEKEVKSEDKSDNYTRQEFSYSSFTREFRLPEVVDEDGIKARYKDGILMVTLPKKEEAQKHAMKKEIKIA